MGSTCRVNVADDGGLVVNAITGCKQPLKIPVHCKDMSIGWPTNAPAAAWQVMGLIPCLCLNVSILHKNKYLFHKFFTVCNYDKLKLNWEKNA